MTRRRTTTALATGVLLATVSYGAVAQLDTGEDAERPPWLDGHLTVPNPAVIAAAAAEVIYRETVDDMTARYRITRDPVAETYLDWPRYNTAPYRSATHGERYVNNYANEPDYGQFGAVVPMPVGTVAAKDTFTVLDDGRVFPGPLMIMEKMAAGFDPDGNDWRYTMILPDGTIFGTTGGAGAENVAYCEGCHAIAAEQDFLYFMPPDYRP